MKYRCYCVRIYGLSPPTIYMYVYVHVYVYVYMYIYIYTYFKTFL